MTEKLLPGARALWNGARVQVVDPTDPKLRIAESLVPTISLVVADNGQLVWVRDSDLVEEER